MESKDFQNAIDRKDDDMSSIVAFSACCTHIDISNEDVDQFFFPLVSPTTVTVTDRLDSDNDDTIRTHH